MFHHYRLFKIISLCLNFFFVVSSTFAQPETRNLIGGSSIKVDSSPFVVVESTKSICSGTLIAPKIIITAAHCISDSAENFKIHINNQQIQAKEVIVNSDFLQDSEYSFLQASNDLAVVILEQEVSEITPLPIVFNLPADYSGSADIVGFGSNESSAQATSYKDNARTGAVEFRSLWSGLLYYEAASSQSTLCAGDSGGSLLQKLPDTNISWLLAVNVAGTNQYDSMGNCIPGETGSSYAVNLSSASSSKFLSNFEGITYINGSDEIGRSLESRIKKIRTSSKKIAKSELKNIRALIKQIRPLMSPENRFKVLKLSNLLRDAVKSHSKLALTSILLQSNRVASRLNR